MVIGAPRRATLEDVALAAGVSRATVSRVVREIPNVDPDIVSRVRKAINKTGYRANIAARALAGGETQNIGLVFRENFANIFMNGYWGQMLEGIYAVLGQRKYQVTILINTPDRVSENQAYLLNHHVDGAIFLGTSTEDRLPRILQKNDVPVVVLGEPHQGNRLARVTGDDSSAGEIAAEVLLKAGCKNIGLISGSDEIAANQDRINGFSNSLAILGYSLQKSHIESGGFTQRGGQSAIEKLLRRFPDIDGVFVLSDLMAAGVLDKLHRMNRRVPEDISVIGCDNSPAGEFTNPKLTTIDYTPYQQGASAANLLLEVMAGGPIKSLVFPPKLIIRESTK